MAFRRSFHVPESVRKARVQKEVDREMEFQENVVGPLMGLDEKVSDPNAPIPPLTQIDLDEEAALLEQMKQCICPKKGCKIHPDS